MVKPQKLGPLPTEDQVQPELTGLDQLTEQERERIAARRAGADGQRPLLPPQETEPLERTDRAVPMTRRSWYATQAASDALAAAVDDIHHATREPKHKVVSALFQLAAEQGHLVERYLGRPGRREP